jgi:hypothetical protein
MRVLPSTADRKRQPRLITSRRLFATPASSQLFGLLAHRDWCCIE